MPALDPTTLLQVDAMFIALALTMWLVMAQLFRLAPIPCMHLAAAHALLLPALLAPGTPDLSEAWIVLAMAQMTIGLRKLLRLRVRQRQVLTLLVLGILGEVLEIAPTHVGSYPVWAQGADHVLQSLSWTGLALIVCHDLLLGTQGEHGGVRLVLVLPTLILALALLLHLAAPQSFSTRTDAGLAAGWLLLNMALTTGQQALVVRRLIQRIDLLSRRDALTGLPNRRELDEQLQSHEAMLRRGQPHGLVLMDLDHFKRINDELGHAAGDAALRHVAGVLRAQLRDTDVIARWGGEEFAMLLPECSLEQAVQTAERLRRALSTKVWIWRGRPWPISASFGVSACEARSAHAPAGRLQAALEAADQALLTAKREGRDRVYSAAETVPEGSP